MGAARNAQAVVDAINQKAGRTLDTLEILQGLQRLELQAIAQPHMLGSASAHKYDWPCRGLQFTKVSMERALRLIKEIVARNCYYNCYFSDVL